VGKQMASNKRPDAQFLPQLPAPAPAAPAATAPAAIAPSPQPVTSPRRPLVPRELQLEIANKYGSLVDDWSLTKPSTPTHDMSSQQREGGMGEREQ
jgi:hypothetical protein